MVVVHPDEDFLGDIVGKLREVHCGNFSSFSVCSLINAPCSTCYLFVIPSLSLSIHKIHQVLKVAFEGFF